MNKISIRFTVVSLFLFLSSLIIVSMFYIQYIFSQELIQRSIKDQILLLSSKVEDNINFIDKFNSNTINTVSDILENKDINDFLEFEKTYIKLFTNVLLNNKNIYATFVGFVGDDFFELINLNIDKNLRKNYGATSNDRWLFIKIFNGDKQLILLDSNLNETSIKTLSNDYKSTGRPWYQKAINNKNVIKTQPYNFSNIDGKGVTYAKNIPSTKNVFAFDLLINNLNNILKTYNAEVLENSYILDKDGHILASSSNDTKNIITDKIRSIVKNNNIINSILNDFEIDNRKYML